MTDSLSSLAGVVILAGGASRRMGTPKAELILPTSERLLDYHVRQAIDLNVPIMIADNERGFTVAPELLSGRSQSPVFHISDYRSTTATDHSNSHHGTGGALVAIESAMQAIVDLMDSVTSSANYPSWLMVISCDSLIPATDLWQKLQPYTIGLTHNDITKAQQAQQVPDKQVICLTDETYLSPLLGLYHLSIEPDLKTYIDSGERQVMKFIKPITQDIPIIKEWQPLTNFNKPEDFMRACTALYH